MRNKRPPRRRPTLVVLDNPDDTESLRQQERDAERKPRGSGPRQRP